ncbi:lipocalin family protein [Klebsiella oxytoca]|uniref:lipocalin family protein n=1 Tax=Klebsiella oxytoca TaxID=571 RepID=UPI0007DADC42|nr:lipocalin family protein [Klebsiella oxytoca]ELG4818397.1 lipocalin family protein [Klebsiella oxytoca]ELK5561370.1 lipocalin family protein [Klebsiella oxytoca]ELK5571046.1 lipocalin family protein [Klebsiella oxytoca]ELM1662532.1 lipocalin family protein [Klebsiella oxytoca]MCY3426713.1 lipocalin family protein [Klebsiella oxytoca]
MRLLPVMAVVAASFLLIACSTPTPPTGVTVVSPFDTQRYLGTWYEIARFDHNFESGLEKVTATYSLRDDGGLNVVNKGYNPDRDMWQKTDGVAYFTGAPTRAALKVSFFGPFYGGYNVISLDKDYRYALVCGPDRDYLWLLARAPKIPPEVKQQMLDIASRQGFDVSKLIWVNQRY